MVHWSVRSLRLMTRHGRLVYERLHQDQTTRKQERGCEDIAQQLDGHMVVKSSSTNMQLSADSVVRKAVGRSSRIVEEVSTCSESEMTRF